MKFQTINKLDVFRHFSRGNKILVGQLAQNSGAVYFQYDSDYLTHYQNLSPFKLHFSGELNKAPRLPHQGLHGVFADSLPDGWGLLLMDRVFRQQGILSHQLTAMDRLAYIGDAGMGALSYLPSLEWEGFNRTDLLDLSVLAEQALLIFDGKSEEVLASLANAGGSGGARPKALIYLDPDKPERVSTVPQANLQPWLVKFTSQSLMLGHEEGLCEAAYLAMAKKAGIDVPVWRLFNAPDKMAGKVWLGLKRFDCSAEQADFGRYHMHTLCGLLGADFRQPSLDYEDTIKAGQVLCRSPKVGQLLFSRAIFNLFSLNQDDHSKNISFLMNDSGEWNLAPFYDVTFSPSPHNQHMSAFVGYEQKPPLKVIQQLASQANFSSWSAARFEISRIVEAIHQWSSISSELGVGSDIRKLICHQHNEIYKLNKKLL